MKKIIAIITFAFLASCSTLPKEKAITKDVVHAIKAEALLGYEYAQMAENTYKPYNTFTLPKSILNVENVDSDWSGLAYSIFHRKESGELKEVILSFRGTENNWVWFKDWIAGNILGLQNNRGLNVYKELRKHTPSNTPITVIGHSLGGAIALHISLREDNVKTFVFNTSSRFTRGEALDNERHSYAEYADVNKILRVFAIDPKWKHSIYSCTFGNPIKNHAQDDLAACLTFCASKTEDNSGALESIKNNPLYFKDTNISERACI
jgi:hypothetical protein